MEEKNIQSEVSGTEQTVSVEEKKKQEARSWLANYIRSVQANVRASDNSTSKK